MYESRVTSKGQTTLPKDVRAALDIKAGDNLLYVVSDGEARIAKAKSVKSLKGILARATQGSVSLKEMDEAIASSAVQGCEPTK